MTDDSTEAGKPAQTAEPLALRLNDQLGLVARLRERRILATSGPLGTGKSNAQLCWLTAHQDPDCAAAADEIERLEHEAAFYRRRVQALEQWQSRMRDPERTVVCDIIANGFTLDPPVPRDRYEVKA